MANDTMESARLIADLVLLKKRVRSRPHRPVSSLFNSNRGEGIRAAMERPCIVCPFASRCGLSSSSRGAVTFRMVQSCHGTGVGCCGIYEQDAAAIAASQEPDWSAS